MEYTEEGNLPQVIGQCKVLMENPSGRVMATGLPGITQHPACRCYVMDGLLLKTAILPSFHGVRMAQVVKALGCRSGKSRFKSPERMGETVLQSDVCAQEIHKC